MKKLLLPPLLVVCALSGAITTPAQSRYEPYAITTLAGLAGAPGSADGTGSAARFDQPHGVAVDSAGNLYIGDQNNSTIRKITSGGVVSTLAGLAGNPGSDDGTGSAARFDGPRQVAVDNAGNVYVADSNNNTIRKITAGAVVSTLAGLAGNPGSADGTGSAARFDGAAGVAVDNAGNVYVADSNNNTIRKITAGAVVSTLAGLAGNPGSADGTGSAARFSLPVGVAVDSAGNVYVADRNNYTVRKVTSGGVVSTLAGLAGNPGSTDGTGSAAQFNQPRGVAVDSAGNVYVVDTDNHTIRKITSGGVVSTLAGLAGAIGSADGTGNAAQFNQPRGVAVDSTGNIYIADSNNDTIRAGTLAPPVITSPLSASATVGQQFTYQFEANGATSLAASNLPPGLIFDSTLGSIVGNPTTASIFQVGLSASNAGGTTTATLTITVQPAPSSGPVIISGTAATGRTGQPFSFHVITTGGSPAARLSASALPLGLTADPVAGLISGTVTSDGSSAVTLTITDGNLITTSTLQLTFTSDPAVPVIISPDRAALTPGEFFSYTINAPSSADPSTDPTIFTLIGSLPMGLAFDAATGTISGTYTGLVQESAKGGPRKPEQSGGILLGNVQLFGTNSHGTSSFPLYLLLAPSGAVNISTRLQVGTGNNVLIGGFIITGDAPAAVLIRALGPSIGVPGALEDPTLELRDGSGALIRSNDNWRDNQEQLIINTTIPPTNDHESAIVAGLDAGAYTAIVAGKDGGTGIGLVEVYDLGTASHNISINARLANIATRGFADIGNNVMIGGFIVRQAPDTNTSVIVRALGPSLTQFGITNALADPTLELRDGNGALLVANNDWQDDPAQAAQLTAAGLAPTNQLESGIAAMLPPGPYTAIVRGFGGTTGVAVVEAYALN